ncbi:MAG: aminopeptidase, partial [Gammaproteobacteria bacterium]
MTKALVSTDTHSFAEPEHFRIRNVDLDLEVSFDRRQLGGIAILSIERLSANSDSLVLDTRDLAVTAVAGSEDGGAFSKRNWHLGPRDSLLGSALIIQVTPRDRFVSIAYSTSPDASGLQWLEPSQTASRHSPFLYTQSQEIHARSWIPLQDTPSVRVTFSAKITAPRRLRPVMGADSCLEIAPVDRYEFRMMQPIPAYLIALAVGNIDFVATGKRTGVYTEPPMLTAAAREFADTERMLQAAEQLYGPY